MNIKDYKKLPEGLGKDDVKKYCDILLEEAEHEPTNATLDKLDEMGIRQWDTYETPDEDLQDRLTDWINKNLELHDQRMIEGALKTIYSFSLSKDLYEKYLNVYIGEFKDQCVEILNNAHGDRIDPYWRSKKI